METNLVHEMHEFTLQLFITGTLLWVIFSLSSVLYKYGTGSQYLKKKPWGKHNEQILNISIVGAIIITTYRNGGVAWLMILIALSLTLAIFMMMGIYLKKQYCGEYE